MKSGTHLSLNVRNVEASTQFYATLFNQEPHKLRNKYANFAVDELRLKLALNEAQVSKGSALDHLGILVETSEKVWAERERLQHAGLETTAEAEVECCHAKQDKFWVSDPDGNRWEVYTILDDHTDECCAEAENKSAECCAPTCCA